MTVHRICSSSSIRWSVIVQGSQWHCLLWVPHTTAPHCSMSKPAHLLYLRLDGGEEHFYVSAVHIQWEGAPPYKQGLHATGRGGALSCKQCLHAMGRGTSMSAWYICHGKGHLHINKVCMPWGGEGHFHVNNVCMPWRGEGHFHVSLVHMPWEGAPQYKQDLHAMGRGEALPCK